MNLTYKLALSDKAGVNPSAMTVKAVLSTPTEDRDGDVIDPLGLDTSRHKKNPVVLWCHDSTMPPIGKAEEDGVYSVCKDAAKVIGTTTFSKSSAFAEQLFRLYEEDILRAWSVGFEPVKAEPRKSGRGRGLHHKQWRLMEYSAVGIGCNPDALTVRLQKGFGLKDKFKEQLLSAALMPFALTGKAWSNGWTLGAIIDAAIDYEKGAKTPAELRQLSPLSNAPVITPAEGDMADEALTKADEELAAKAAGLQAQLDAARGEAGAHAARAENLAGEVEAARAEAARHAAENVTLKSTNAALTKQLADGAVKLAQYKALAATAAASADEFRKAFKAKTGKEF